MFNHLIESNSHAKEFRRRGSFLIFTTITYVFVFAIAGVVSIYAYDTHLDQQVYESILMMQADNFTAPTERPECRCVDSGRKGDHMIREPKEPTTLPVDHSTSIPTVISTAPVTGVALPIPQGIRSIGDPPSYGGTGAPGFIGPGFQRVPTKTPNVEIDEPPPLPTPTPVTIVRATTIVNGQAIYLPKPSYPLMAKNIRIQGAVNIQVLIDETGRVVSAKAVSGPALLLAEATKAATLARFSPTMLNGKPVKLSGVIVYNFVLN